MGVFNKQQMNPQQFNFPINNNQRITPMNMMNVPNPLNPQLNPGK